MLWRPQNPQALSGGLCKNQLTAKTVSTNAQLTALPATTLKSVIDSNPAAFLGSAHAARYGSNPAVLAKIIDSLGRLTIQVHPDKAFAKQVLNSDYGKTECWYILGGREVNGEKPYVLMGFASGGQAWASAICSFSSRDRDMNI